VTETIWTAPVTGTYLFEPGQEPRLLTDGEAQEAPGPEPTVMFDVTDTETTAYQTTGHAVALPSGQVLPSGAKVVVFMGGDTVMNSGSSLSTGEPTFTVPWR
jgi:hypothetical protein